MTILAAARQVARLLSTLNAKVVFAESCTAGLISASLARVPGIAAYHCGGMVTYRNETKTAYLGIAPELIEREGVVSSVVALAMARGILEQTPEASYSVSITGHLGPDAPAELDGVVFLGFGERKIQRGKPRILVHTHRMIAPPELKRYARQKLAALTALEQLAHLLQNKLTDVSAAGRQPPVFSD